MAEKNADTDKRDYWEFFLKREWSYTTGAVVLALLATMYVLVNNKAWGVTSAFSFWGAKFFQLLGAHVENWPILNGKITSFNFLKHTTSLTDLGIVLGALMATLLAASFKIKKLRSKRQFFAGALGGLCMGVGARLAQGCNIGGFFSTVPAFSLQGWVYALFFFGGAAVGSWMLKKWFM